MLRCILCATALPVLLSGCRKAEDDEPDPGVLRWEVVPAAGKDSVFTRGTFEHDYRDKVGIHAEPHSECKGGEILGIGKHCSTAGAALVGEGGGASIDIEIDGAWRVGSIAVSKGLYVAPDGTMIRIGNGTVEVSAVQRSPTTKLRGAALVAYLCARGSAELVQGDTVVGTVRFAVAHESPHDRDVDPPSCSADL